MTTLTANQAEQLAQEFQNCANAIDDRLETDWKTLDDTDQQTLISQAQQIQAKASLFANQAVGMILDETKDALGQISKATATGKSAIEYMQTVDKVISVAGSLVDLGTAIASKDPVASLKAAETLLDQVT